MCKRLSPQESPRAFVDTGYPYKHKASRSPPPDVSRLSLLRGEVTDPFYSDPPFFFDGRLANVGKSVLPGFRFDDVTFLVVRVHEKGHPML